MLKGGQISVYSEFAPIARKKSRMRIDTKADKGFGRGAADTLGAGAAIEAAVASDQREHRAENQRLPQSR